MLTTRFADKTPDGIFMYEPLGAICFNGRSQLQVERSFQPAGKREWHHAGRVLVRKNATRAEVTAAFTVEPDYDD